jgi:hypothetical protein
MLETLNDMTIFDLPALDPADALALVRETLAIHPVLTRFYDDDLIGELIRRRAAYDNTLLLQLVRPDDELNTEYWNEVVEDLLVLEADGGFDAFRAKFRERDSPSLDSVRTELFFAAWLKRNGIDLVLEPPVGQRRCEFVAETTPQTWWEIKTPLDLEELRLDGAVQMDVQRRLRSIEQPYVLSLRRHDLPLLRVAGAVKAIKRDMRAHHLAGGTLPHAFESDGLVIGADATTTRPNGYLGTMMGKPQMFENENSARVVRRIIDAADQIPAEGAGVIVIDRSSSDWIDHYDVEDACYGEEQFGVLNGQLINGRLPGVFDDLSKARISAVVSYTRRWREDPGTLMTVLHNPNALKPLAPNVLRFGGVRQTRREADGRGFRLVTTPEDEAAHPLG